MATVTALATGNTVAFAAGEELQAPWSINASCLADARLPSGVFTLLPLKDASSALSEEALAGVLVHAQSVYLHDVARKLALRDGPILPLISCVTPAALLRQTLLEKTISIDTTAAGGNASLMTMDAH